jgi:hypothetical protein
MLKYEPMERIRFQELFEHPFFELVPDQDKKNEKPMGSTPFSQE